MRNLRKIISTFTPDSQPDYKDLGNGKWSMGGRVYPVQRPKRGKLIKLPTRNREPLPVEGE